MFPYLGLDVDGVLRPLGSSTSPAMDVYTSWGAFSIPESMIPRVHRLQGRFTLCWYTTWLEDANYHLSPKLKLPALSVIPIGEGKTSREAKIEGVRQWMRMRRFWNRIVLVDDEVMLEEKGISSYAIDPMKGLTDDDVDSLILQYAK